MPLMICFLNSRKTIRDGINANSEEPNSIPYSMFCDPMMVFNPIGSVSMCDRCREIIDQKNSFHEKMKIHMTTAPTAGLLIGNRILNNTPRLLQPSIRAASSNSWGMLIRNWRRRNMPIGMDAIGRKTPGWVFRRFSAFATK